jgi:hypothetical protein
MWQQQNAFKPDALNRELLQRLSVRDTDLNHSLEPLLDKKRLTAFIYVAGAGKTVHWRW